MDTDKKYLYDNATPKFECTGSQTKLVSNVGWTWLLALAGFSTTIGSAIPIGWTIGVLNSPAGIIKRWLNGTVATRYDMEITEGGMEILWAGVVSSFLVGGMIGSFTGAWLSNKIGRKGALFVASGITFVTAIMFVIARPLNSVELIFLARFITGLSSGLSMSVMPIYLAEIAPLELRGAVGVLCPLGVTSGVVFAQIFGLPQVLGTEEYWHYLLGFFGLLTVAGALAFPVLPESPKYLFIVKGAKQKALSELSRLRNLPEDLVCCELEASEETTGENWSYGKVLGSRDLWLNLSLVIAFNVGQQCSGINAVFYYSVSIFESAGLNQQNAQYASLAAAVMNLIVSVIMIPLINVFPRRALSITSCTLATAFLVLLCFSISFMNEIAWLSYVSIVAVLAYVLVYGLALGPVPYFLGTELFDVGPRPIAMALGTAGNWIGNLTVGLFFPTMQNSMGAYSFLAFAASTALLSVFIKISLPETNVNILGKQRRTSVVPPCEKI